MFSNEEYAQVLGTSETTDKNDFYMEKRHLVQSAEISFHPVCVEMGIVSGTCLV